MLADESQANSELAATLLNRSSAASRETAAMYPSSIPVQLQYALFAFSDGDAAGAIEGWRQVDAIESSTPHADRKLAAATVYLPDRLRAGWGVDGDPSWGRDSSGFVRAEPAFARLRSSLQLSE